MPSLIAHLTKKQQAEFFENLNYLNVAEYRGFCDRHKISFAVYVQTPTGLKKTKETDRKGTVLKRIRHYLKTGKVLPPTVIPAKIVRNTKLASTFSATTRLYFCQYDKKNKRMIAFLKALTGGKFKNGAVARVLLRDYWTNGKAPTFGEFAKKWMQTSTKSLLAPEYAYLTDLATGDAKSDWKKVRVRKANLAQKVLDGI